MSPIFALAIAFSVLAPAAHAGDLKTPFVIENTAVLPKGIRNPRFIDVFTSADTRFGDGGEILPLAYRMNKNVSWNDVFAAQEDPQKKASVQGLLEKNGIDAATTSPGSTSGQVNLFADVKIAAIAAGITDRFTLAAVLPIVRMDVSADTGFITNPDGTGTKFVNAASKDSSPFTAAEAINKLNDAVNQKLVRLGYEPIPSRQSFTRVGDLQLVGKFRMYSGDTNGLAFKATVILPTGKAPDANKALDLPTGDGRVGLGTSLIHDMVLPLDTRWNNYAALTTFMPRYIDRRVPASVDDWLSADRETLYERPRYQLAVGTALEHVFPSVGIVTGAGYAYQYMTSVDYRPGAFAAERYEVFRDIQPLQAMHSVLLTAGFSTIEWFRQKKFVYPFQVSFTYTHPLAGRNVPNNDLFAGELILFF
jgi:hypothetical protein